MSEMESKLVSCCQTWINMAEIVVVLTIFDFIVSLLFYTWLRLTNRVLGYNKQHSHFIGDITGNETIRRKGKRVAVYFLAIKLVLLMQHAMTTDPTFQEAIVSSDVVRMVNNTTQMYRVLDKDNVRILQEPGWDCVQTNRVFLIVPTVPGNVVNRNRIRAKFNRTEQVFLVFLLGNTHDHQVQDSLIKEGNEHGDILQTSVIESYKSVIYKILMGFLWANLHCSNVKYIIKIDDNVQINFDKIFTVLDSKYGINTVYGDHPPDIMECPAVIRNMRPWRHNHTGTILGKWSVSVSSMPHRVYPPFCLGWLYITTPTVAFNILQVALDKNTRGGVDWTDITDDIFITGFLREHLPDVTISQLDNGLTDKIPCPWVGITKNIFKNNLVLSKSSGDVAYVGGLRFYWCIIFELGILDKLEQITPNIIPDLLWNLCSR